MNRENTNSAAADTGTEEGMSGLTNDERREWVRLVNEDDALKKRRREIRKRLMTLATKVPMGEPADGQQAGRAAPLPTPGRRKG